MKKNLIQDTAHLLLSKHITKDDIIVDATMGNGHDTLFLANLAKKVYAFDIQQQALQETKKRLDQAYITNVELILDTHEKINHYVSNIKGVVFNLGYLPNADKTITTTKDSTINALHQILPNLKPNDFVLLVVYIRHQEGQIESESLQSYLSKLNPTLYKILKIELPYQTNQPPYIIFIQKEKDEG
ncbi:class I SAM-dependent methyltransferase [Peloplasma aerotolerans]|uniref:Class I SAM-dependent methyltransferase n=1 Tax=Peloplasma aerotolerans TaxID=3044389 RepID=A0AAW6UAX4_9MOLU|nr:class I SAM-dependent methyltransferase [Mariniplasma sp. M4Ah]MDI6453567.1 class I SAM-dependent methyltransferase [Mariniplasma sp. M4Ah]